MKSFNCFECCFLYRISHAQESRRFSVHGNEHHGLAVFPHILGLCRQPAGIDPQLIEKRAIAERDSMTVHLTR